MKDLPNGLSSLDVKHICKQYLIEKNASDLFDLPIKVIEYDLNGNGDGPSGFLADHQLLMVLVERLLTDGSKKQDRLKFFLKSAPAAQSRLDYITEIGVFAKEVNVYSVVLPTLQKYVHDRYFAPRCYYSKEDILVMEDLNEQGFRLGTGRDGIFDMDHLKCCLKALATFHGSSIVFEEKSGKSINQTYPLATTENAYPKDNEARTTNFMNGTAALMELIKVLPKYKSQLDLILKKFPEKMKLIFEYTKTSSEFRNVFQHGDLWANNVMFKHFNKRPVECRFVDFQLTRYAPPIVDVITVLTIPTAKAFRSQHLKELLDFYYQCLKDFVETHNLKLEDHLSKAEFDKTAETFKIIGIIESLLFSHLTILPSESTKSLTETSDGFTDFFNLYRNEIVLKAFKNDSIYRERLTDMLEDMIESYIL
ncbi:hypothetical protein ACFFRR_004966 [Megaselia abdita]